MYPIQEIFYSLQGEGFHAGTACVFVRLSGCNVGCPWCDTKETWTIGDSVRKYSAQEILEKVAQYNAKQIVITGGEPSLYKLSELTELLRVQGYYVSIETSGTNILRGEFDWVCVSPKPHFAPKDEVLQLASELKVVIEKESDFEFAERMLAKTNKNTMPYLQIEWNSINNISNTVIEYVKTHPKWKLSMQTQKILQIR